MHLGDSSVYHCFVSCSRQVESERTVRSQLSVDLVTGAAPTYALTYWQSKFYKYIGRFTVTTATQLACAFGQPKFRSLTCGHSLVCERVVTF